MHNIQVNNNGINEIAYANNSDTNDIEFQFQSIQPKKQRKNKFGLCLSSSCMCFTMIILICIMLGYIVWLIFAIKALNNTSNEDIKDTCKKSDIWVTMLVIVVISGCTMISSLTNGKKEEENEEETSPSKIVLGVLQFCLQAALTIWVGLELNTNCAKNNLSDENIYILLNYWFYFGCSMIILTLLLFLIYGCLMSQLFTTD